MKLLPALALRFTFLLSSLHLGAQNDKLPDSWGEIADTATSKDRFLRQVQAKLIYNGGGVTEWVKNRDGSISVSTASGTFIDMDNL